MLFVRLARTPLLLLAVLLALAAAPSPARAAGETTHAWMVERAITFLPKGPLKRLLRVNRLQAIAGAAYPDTGYWVEPGPFPQRPNARPSDDFGETSHWERFINAYVAHIRKRDCGDLTDPAGPCAPMIAHLMGAAGHGMGDELWDWLFEPAMADHGEDPAENFFSEGGPAAALAGNPLDDASSSPEYAMDEVAVWRYGKLLPPQLPAPPVSDLVAVYADLGLNVTPEHILTGHAVGLAMISAEHAVAPKEGPRVERDMPWSAGHFVTEPGGVDDLGHAIDGYMRALWRKLRSDTHPAPVVTRRYPHPGADDVPATWLPARTSPGPYGGGSRNRIIFVLSNAVDAASLTPSTARLLDADGAEVTLLPGFPRPGPYGAADGTHAVLLYPAADLEPCARYRVEVTTGVRDMAGAPLEHPDRWGFRTAGCRARP
jgi:hypothetical protein